MVVIDIGVCMCEVTGKVTEYNHTGYAAIENVNTIGDRRSNIVRNRVFDCHLSPNWRQMTIENTISSDF